MTTTTTINPQRNGSKRPSLSDQIVRLDRMLDGLSEGLNEAVADAVKVSVGQAIREAVHGVLTEVLANPDVLAKLRPPVPPVVPNAPARVTIWQRLRTCLAGIRDACARGVDRVQSSADNLRAWMGMRLLTFWGICQMLSPFKYHVMSALAIGILVGVGVWFAGAWLGVIGSAIGGFVTTLCVQASVWLRTMFSPETEQMA